MCTYAFLQAGTEDIKQVLAQLSQLRYELLTDKTMECLKTGEDLKEWDMVFASYKEKFKGEGPKWFAVSWLFAECFMYRKIVAILKSRYINYTMTPSLCCYCSFIIALF